MYFYVCIEIVLKIFPSTLGHFPEFDVIGGAGGGLLSNSGFKKDMKRVSPHISAHFPHISMYYVRIDLRMFLNPNFWGKAGPREF